MTDRFEVLWAEFLDGDLDAAGVAELQRLLDTDPALCRRAADLYEVHRGLGFVSQPVAPAAVAAVLLGRIRAEQEPPPPTPRPAPPGRANPRRLLQHAAVGTVAAALAAGVTLALTGPRPVPPLRPAEVAAGDYVATLLRVQQAEWGGPMPPTGGRLRPGDYALRGGAAVFQFDGGATALVTGPAEVRVESRSGLAVRSGRVSVRAPELAAGFVLRTPARDVIDLGTEFTVAVEPSGTTEVHVLEGAVETTRGGAADALFRAGEAVRFDPDVADEYRKIPLRGGRVGPQLDAIPADAGRLLAAEAFDYPAGDVPLGRCDGGTGWVGPWRFRVPVDHPDGPILTTDQALPVVPAADAGFGRRGGVLALSTITNRVRPLAAPVAMDADAVYYLSFRTRAEPAAPADPAAATQLASRLTLRSSAEWSRQAVGFWLNRSGRPQINSPLFGGYLAPAPRPIDRTCLWVAKIVASRSARDQVFLSVYGPDEPVPEAEPADWLVRTNEFRSDSRFDLLHVNAVSPGRYWHADIRLGTSWAVVTRPAGGP